MTLYALKECGVVHATSTVKSSVRHCVVTHGLLIICHFSVPPLNRKQTTWKTMIDNDLPERNPF